MRWKQQRASSYANGVKWMEQQSLGTALSMPASLRAISTRVPCTACSSQQRTRADVLPHLGQPIRPQQRVAPGLGTCGHDSIRRAVDVALELSLVRVVYQAAAKPPVKRGLIDHNCILQL